jgi:mono/diheme cytochrome c family protein
MRGSLGEDYERVEYLKQGWTEGESAWFYTANQGSDLLPYDFFLSLAAASGDGLLRSDANVERWRYLPQKASKLNPDGLPVGFARDEYKGKAYLGLTCAACHTSQVNYNKAAIRIDGGPSMADMQSFMRDLEAALKATLGQVDSATGKCGGDVCKQFVDRVLALRNYSDEGSILRDLQTTTRRVETDALINAGGNVETDDAFAKDPKRYGYARLDAFGRIFNRLLSRLLRKEDLMDILPDVFDANELPDVKAALKPLTDGDDLVERALSLLPQGPKEKKLIHGVFNESNAPVSYPFLWDTPQHDYVQWNGIVANSTFGPVGRNAGEVIGVFGTLDWRIENGPSLAALLSGQGLLGQGLSGQGLSGQGLLGQRPLDQGLFGRHVRYESSIYVHNLRRIEAQLAKLQAPKWTDVDVFPPIQWGRIGRGEAVFDTYCVACHANIDSDPSNRRVVASMTKLGIIGTDETMARNSVNDSGYSGMLRNQYVDFPVGNVLLDRRPPVAALLTQATHGVIAEPYPNANVFRRGADWLMDLATSYFSNVIHPSIKEGQYDPDTTADPFASLRAYKGRSLDGIWATAPYLHNGSVPTLYDLLLPKRLNGDPREGEYRPDKFVVGSREFDPEKVGFVSQDYHGFEFDTSRPGNANTGHEYGTIHDPRGSKDFRPLTRDERTDLLEYLKTL